MAAATTTKAALALAVVAGFLLQAPVEAAVTKKHEVRAWTANVRMMSHDGDRSIWKKLVRRMAAERVLPDVLSLNEMCDSDVGGAPGNDARQFARFLRKKTGVRYSWRHSSTRPAACWAADTMVLWRTPRFSFTGVTRWRSLGDAAGDGDRRCSSRQGPNSRQIGVALRDRLQERSLVLASVHFPVGRTRACINENAALLDRRLEDLRGRRGLTVVGGDFNQLPQLESPSPGDELSAGTQSDPECWYRSLSLLTVSDRERCPAARRSSARHYGRGLDRYLDAVQADHQGPAPGTTSIDICEEWTRSRAFASDGTSCTDVSGRRDRPDGLMDRGRIDYLWARWELRKGKARSFTSQEAADLVRRAGADKVPPPRYSDHRAVKATISWCLPGERCTR